VTDWLSGLTAHWNFPNVFQKLKKSRTAHTESAPVMPRGSPANNASLVRPLSWRS
jgi:hypothetical protein